MKDADNKPDLVLCTAPLAIFFTGLFFIYSASWREGQPLDQILAVRQALWMIFSIVIVWTLIQFHYRFFLGCAWFLYGLALALLILVLFCPARLGAHRWIGLGFFNLQPSEIAKIAVPVALAAFLKDRDGASKRGIWFYLVPFFVTGFPLVLILKEPDLGTGLLLIPVLLAMLLVAGLPKRWAAALFAAAATAAPFLYHHLKDYQKKRILNFMDPDRDPLGSGYHIIQSKIAIGSGGLFGKGYLEGSQTQLRFLPERHTDFIFSVVGEEGGFVAAAFVLVLCWLIIHRGYDIAERCSNRFGKLLATGVTTLLATQALINIAMTMGLVPVVGIPLFFVSYGGSSLLASVFLVGVLVSIGMRRDPFL